jgi:hypothetical protein
MTMKRTKRAITQLLPETPDADKFNVNQQADFEEFLDHLNERQECIDAVGTILRNLDSGYMRSVSDEELDRDAVTSGLAYVLKMCAAEIRSEMSHFHRAYCTEPASEAKAG